MASHDIFDRLKKILNLYAVDLVCTTDAPGDFSLDTRHTLKNGNPLFFGAVQIRKRYVSYHLMPVYVDPSLLDGISDALHKRMQGKSCFNFTKVDPALFKELSGLTRAGFELYRKEGYV